MSEPEPKEELDGNVTANLSGPPNRNGAYAISDKKDMDLSTKSDFVYGGKGRKGEKIDDGVKMAVDAVDGRNEWNAHNDVDVKMTEAEDAEKDDDVKMAEAEDATIIQSQDTKMAKTEELKKKPADGLGHLEDDVLKKEEANHMKEKEPKNTEKEKANDTSKEEDEYTVKEEAESVKNETVEGMKLEEHSDRKNEESNDLKKEEVDNMKNAEVDSVHNVEMEDKKAEEKSMVEDNMDLTEEPDNDDMTMTVEENKTPGEAERLKKKRNSGQKVGETEKAKEKKQGEKKAKEESKEKKEVEKMAKEARTPVGSSIERPVRERKSVERLVEVLETESVKPFVIDKGRGTTLKDIPNVAYKLSKKKPAELKLLHRTLFGRVGKAIDYKNHILQFSGFVWHESEDKRKTKVKEKLDKCVKDTLLDFCELFDIPVLKAKSNARKEELVAMLLDFMVAPHATTDVILSEKEQLTKSKKRKRWGKWSGSKSSDRSRKQSRKESVHSKDAPKTNEKSVYETEDEDEDEEEEDHEKGVTAEEDAPENSVSMEKESEYQAAAEDDNDKDDSAKCNQEMKSPKIGGLADAKKSKVSAKPEKHSSQTTVKSPIKSEPKQLSSPATAKSPIKSASFKRAKAEDKNNKGAKVVLRKHEDVEPSKNKTVSYKSDPQEEVSGKKVTKSTSKSKESGPSKEELRTTLIEILMKVDFNTATFTDILKELASHYRMDLTPRKAAIKLMTQEELIKLAEAEDEDEDEEDEGDDTFL